MTQLIKNQVVKEFVMVSLSGKHYLKAEPHYCSYTLNGEDHGSWEVRLFPVGGVSGDIRVVFDVVDNYKDRIHVSLSNVFGGCLILK